MELIKENFEINNVIHRGKFKLGYSDYRLYDKNEHYYGVEYRFYEKDQSKNIVFTFNNNLLFQDMEEMTYGQILIKFDDLNKIRSNIEKYKNWNDIAFNNGILITKEIPNSCITANIVYLLEKKEDALVEEINIYFIFNPDYLIISNYYINSYNTIIKNKNNTSIRLYPMLLNIDEVNNLYNRLKIENINKLVYRNANKKVMEELFY
jgi:hypothetical protein